MELTHLLEVLPFYQTDKSIENIHINEIEMNDKLVRNGSLFVCIKGFTVDGHNFAENAVKNGAVAVLAERPLDLDVPVIIVKDTGKALPFLANRFYGQPSEALNVIGITGTNGKTTTTYLIDHIFSVAKRQTAVIGTIETKFANKVYAMKNTTPDILTLQKYFHEMKEADVDTVAMEVSSHALQLNRVNGIDFDVAIFSNLSQDHLDFHKTMEEYFRAKSLLFNRLGNDYRKQRYAIINVDDSYGAQLAEEIVQHAITYSIDGEADLKAENIKYSMFGMEMEIVTANERFPLATKLIGKFNVYNILSAIAAAMTQDIAIEAIQEALASFTGVAGRLEQIDEGQDYGVFVDYAHTPDSLQNVLETVAPFKEGKVYVVVGTGGDRDRMKRPLMGNVACQFADKAIFTTDNPRTEDPEAILQDIVNVLKHDNYEVITDRKEAIANTISRMEKGDMLLIAGKGHETYQEINGVRHHFDDREIAREAIKLKEQMK